MVIYVDEKALKKKQKCKECGKEFEVSARARFKRKYCKKCSDKRKKDYENLWKVTADECEEGADDGGGWG